MAKDTDATTGCLLTILLLLLIPVATLVYSSVMLQHYNWFLASVQGAPKLVYTNFIGVSLIFSMLQGTNASSKEKGDGSITSAIGYAITYMFILPLTSLFFGWIYFTLFL